MQALTLYPAQIWGVDDQLGSLDVGKTANVAWRMAIPWT